MCTSVGVFSPADLLLYLLCPLRLLTAPSAAQCIIIPSCKLSSASGMSCVQVRGSVSNTPTVWLSPVNGLFVNLSLECKHCWLGEISAAVNINASQQCFILIFEKRSLSISNMENIVELSIKILHPVVSPFLITSSSLIHTSVKYIIEPE